MTLSPAITGWLRRADDILRGRTWTDRTGASLATLAAYVVACGATYGGLMGSFGGLAGDRALQIVYSGSKVPVLLLATLVISLPSFFVLNTLFGLRSEFGAALRAVLASQAAMTLILVSLAPLTLFWYASSTNYNAAILFNALMFGVASLGSQVLLQRAYRPLVARNPRHRVLLRAWLGVYAFVGIQLGWVLRPFIGAPDRPVQFFREDSWGNAYVIVARIVWDTIGHRAS